MQLLHRALQHVCGTDLGRVLREENVQIECGLKTNALQGLDHGGGGKEIHLHHDRRDGRLDVNNGLVGVLERLEVAAPLLERPLQALDAQTQGRLLARQALQGGARPLLVFDGSGDGLEGLRHVHLLVLLQEHLHVLDPPLCILQGTLSLPDLPEALGHGALHRLDMLPEDAEAVPRLAAAGEAQLGLNQLAKLLLPQLDQVADAPGHLADLLVRNLLRRVLEALAQGTAVAPLIL
mmetsp:Transcript_116997/g.364266  ORF Transcript_116997/g.364266 Transcript_116997/m.364266 type:complete len:236 (+) Transcript_116997:866-1573(+)